MSRTYRSNPSTKRRYPVGREIISVEQHPEIGEITITRTVWVSLSKGGWKEAKRVLSKEEYAHQRTLCGDKLTHYLGNGGVVWWYRNAIEKQHRAHTKRELYRFTRNPEHEPMVSEGPNGCEYYYWY